MIRDPHVLALCDDLFIQAHQLAGWITDYVDLEESLAVGSISQELLAHSAALMGICGFGPEARDERIFRRAAAQWCPSQVSCLPDRNWPATVVRGFLLNRAMIAIRPYLAVPDKPRVQQLAEVINAEEDLHAGHWFRWVNILAGDADTAVEFQQEVDRALVDASDLFGSVPVPGDEVAESELLLHERDLVTAHSTWVNDVSDLLTQCGLVASAVPTEVRARTAGGACVDEVLRELGHARESDGTSNYEIYQ
jgi:1,2-phenylacetyl-CoA epoxidase catalytic subunit